jgi:hypothetical protein
MAVVVAIEKRHAAAHGFGEQFGAVRAIDMGESDASLAGDVGEFSDGDLVRAGASMGHGQKKENRDCEQREETAGQASGSLRQTQAADAQADPLVLCEGGFVWHFEISQVLS